jgi:tetratricopeptide (TPR) repeat protein
MSSKGKHRKSKKKKMPAPSPSVAPVAGVVAAPVHVAPVAPVVAGVVAAPVHVAPVEAAPVAPEVLPEEDLSVPPVGDLATRFFDSSSSIHDDSGDLHELELRDARARAMAPAAVRRRAQLARYVKGTVAFASVLCVAALVKAAVTRDDAGPAPRPLPVVAAHEVPAPTNPSQETAAVEPPEVVEPPAASATMPPAAPAAVTAVAAQARAAEPATAAEETKAAQAALDRGNVAGAIRAGERSVAMDPADGRAWLLLGAAYQVAGDNKDARRSFKACVAQAKRGPKDECAAMLR